MPGQIVNLYLKEKHGAPMKPVDSAVADDGMGLVGDTSYGRRKRQVLIIEKETLDEFDLVPGQVRENITVSGISLAGLAVGSTIRAGEVVFEVTGDCAPCQYVEDIRPGLQAAMEGRRGTLCRVLEGGALAINDQVSLDG